MGIPDCRDEGAFAGLATRRGEALLRFEGVRLVGTAVLEEPRFFSVCLILDGLLLVLDIGTTLLMSLFSEVVRVRIDLDLPDAEIVFGVGFFPLVWTLDVGRLLLGSLDGVAGSAFTLVEEAAFAVLLVESLDAMLFLLFSSVDCFETVTPSLFLLVDTSSSSSSSLSFSEASAVRAGTTLGVGGSFGRHTEEETSSDVSSQRGTGTGWLLMGTGTGFSLAG